MKIRTTLVGCFCACILNSFNSNSQCQLIVTYVPESCFNCCDGAASAQVTISSPDCLPYFYAWNTSPPQTAMTAGNLCAGTYTVTFSDNGGAGCCGSMSATVTIPPFPTNVSDANQTEIEFEIFPNPSSLELNIIFYQNGQYLLTFSDITGKVLKQIQTNTDTLLLNVSDYSPGFYFITVSDEYKNCVTRKFVKM